jgi:hypothetical protein
MLFRENVIWQKALCIEQTENSYTIGKNEHCYCQTSLPVRLKLSSETVAFTYYPQSRYYLEGIRYRQSHFVVRIDVDFTIK